MKKWNLHIYIIALLASLLASCTTMLDEEVLQAKDKVGITFTLSMNGVGATTRSLTADMATQYEKTITRDEFRVLAYTDGGEVHEVTIFSMDEIAEGTYQIAGELKGEHTITKMVVLANCGKSFSTASPLSTLTYQYDKSNFNPETPKNYIPMWGVKKITTPLKPGERTDIGTINLLRAMAKIEVAMVVPSTSELLSASITQYNKKGTCVPGSSESMNDTDYVAQATIPADATQDTDLAFYPVSDKSYMLYLPEYKNTTGTPAEIAIRVKDVNGTVRDKTIRIGKYNSGAFQESWDILRNYNYQFNVRMEVAANGTLDIRVQTEKYAEFDLGPVYGD